MGATHRLPHLSKSRFTSGLQCAKQLWWKVHEPEAPELAAGDESQVVFERGHRIGELARTYVPGGVLVDLPYQDLEKRVAATRKALADGAPAIYEASFLEDGIFVAVDVLERRKKAKDGFVLAEVKSTLDVKTQHLADVAVQVHVVRQAGLVVKRAEVMHLNRECRHPDLSNLFVREAVTRRVQAPLRAVPEQARAMRSMLAGPLPDVATGPHCKDPYPCPFMGRCWPPMPEHHVSTLHGMRSSKIEKLVSEGYQTLTDLPLTFDASGPAERQLRSVRQGRMVVERGLRRALRALKAPIAFLDFETINPAVPVWPGCAPYHQVPVQFSCHVQKPTGLEHHEWLAEGPGDPREGIARALIAACAGTKTVVAYSAGFERKRISELIDALPHLAAELSAISDRINDLLTIVRDHVYHPDFGGSYSIKKVLPALVTGLGYGDLNIQDGGTAAAALETLLLDSTALTDTERKKLRRDLLRYCKRDTLAMVRLHERLLALAAR